LEDKENHNSKEEDEDEDGDWHSFLIEDSRLDADVARVVQ
jgi:hypothetical protein